MLQEIQKIHVEKTLKMSIWHKQHQPGIALMKKSKDGVLYRGLWSSSRNSVN
ncbi:hypothetical protein APHMUC_0721 [Anaplasma phagocytophilum str. ApMUC09]|uniref:Uncharacterized protein n=1 Tax=Anaplasma phagocytophilum str. ApMUC09 TaxID=1359152 RepID=A0A0F3N9H6_ANAPH|nr:hypothetical protein APHMUC_0721 [Anaplasma phagocytophilum str. ApMUC09]